MPSHSEYLTERLQLALDAAEMGTFAWSFEDDRFEADERILAILEASPGEPLSFDGLLKTSVHPDDAARLRRAIAAAGEAATMRIQQDLRISATGGSERCLEIRGVVEFDGTPPEPSRLVGVATDATTRYRAQRRLAGAVSQRAALLMLSDELRPLSDPAEIQAVATRLLGERLRASRVMYVEVEHEPDGDTYLVERDYCAPGIVSNAGRLEQSPDGATVSGWLRAGLTLVVEDVSSDPRMTEALDQYLAAGTLSWVAVPLIRERQLVAILAVHDSSAREWVPEDVALIEATADRTLDAVERGRAEEELRRSEAMMRSVFAAVDDGYCIGDLVYDERRTPVDVRLVAVNPRFEAMTGLSGGDTIRGLNPELDAVWFERLVAVAGSGEPFRAENEWAVFDRYWDVFIGPLEPPGRLVCRFRDITARKLADQRERFRTALADALRPLADPLVVQTTAARLLGEHLHTSRVFYAEPIPDGSGIVITRDHVDGVDTLVGSYRWEEISPDSVGLMANGTTWVAADSAATAGAARRPNFERHSVGAAVAVPLVKDGEFKALLAVNHHCPRRWTDDEVALIEEVAERTWSAIERARAEQELQMIHEEEHRVSLGLQRALLPGGVLQHPGVAIAARYEARSEFLEVGGDWYDSFTLPSGLIAIAAGDVVGHGLEAAATMGKLRVATAALARHANGPGQLLSLLDEFTAGADGAEFATACFATFDPASGTLRFASAGHPPMLVVTPNGEPRWLTGGRSGPLVRDVDPARPDASTTLEPGSLLVLYSDGLIERRGEPIATGLDRLWRAASAIVDATVEQACDALIDAMGVATTRSDDVVVVCLRVPARIIARFRRTLPALPTELAPLRAALLEWVSIHSIETVAPALVLAVGEACGNGIEHAYVDGPPGVIEVSVDQHDGGMLSVAVRDFGRWRSLPGQDGAVGATGRGVAIMRSLTTDFVHHSDTHGTVVTFALEPT
jgi:serine phosphatase RsbU (regulator of sigma subunit)/PAS domain-containing protein/anti-sigma regulatory factor (Ser/Thr protein kinase)